MALQDGWVNFPAKTPKLICALALSLLLGACSPNVPTAKRGAIDFYREGQMTSSRGLVEKEARGIAAWITAHGSGWSRSQVSDTPAVVIRLLHSNREATLINLSGSTVIVSNSSGQFRKVLSPQEAADFRQIVGILPAPGS